MPAAIEKDPKVVNIDMKAAPAVSASSRALRLVSSASSPSGASVGRRSRMTWSVSFAPSSPPPRLETKTALTSPCLPSSRWAGASAMSRPAPSVPPPS